jgi:hypothetical protein
MHREKSCAENKTTRTETQHQLVASDTTKSREVQAVDISGRKD